MCAYRCCVDRFCVDIVVGWNCCCIETVVVRVDIIGVCVCVCVCVYVHACTMQPVQEVYQHMAGVHSSSSVPHDHIWMVSATHVCQVGHILQEPNAGQLTVWMIMSSVKANE